MGHQRAAQVAPPSIVLGLRLAAWTACAGPHDRQALADLRRVARAVAHLDPLQGRQAALQALQAIEAAAVGQCLAHELRGAVAPAVAAFDRLVARTPWGKLAPALQRVR